MPFAATWMDLEIIIVRKVSQKEKATYPMMLLYVESKTWHKSTYLWKRNRLTDTENILMVARDWGAVEKQWIGSLGLEDANHYI